MLTCQIYLAGEFFAGTDRTPTYDAKTQQLLLILLYYRKNVTEFCRESEDTLKNL